MSSLTKAGLVIISGFILFIVVLGANMMVHDEISFPGTAQEQQAKMALLLSTTDVPLWGGWNFRNLKSMKIQDVLGAFLSAHGKHELAQQAFVSTLRTDWDRLGDEAIRSAQEFNRHHVAQVVKLALDDPKNGGPGSAADFEILRESNPVTGAPWYRAYKRTSDGLEDIGLASSDAEALRRRIIGAHVVRKITVVEETK